MSATSRKSNLEKAWDTYKVNPRWIEDNNHHDHNFFCLRKKIYRLASKTESDSEEIPVWGSSVEDIGPVFGIGVGLYFRRMLALFWLLLAYGIVLLPQANYYASRQYNDLSDDSMDYMTKFTRILLIGSAVCTDYQSVEVTVNCDPSSQKCTGRYAEECPLLTHLGIYDFIGSSITFICAILAVCWYMKLVQEIDTSQQTPKDYSIVVHNPAATEDDPDKWKEFFEQRFGQVAYVTVTRKNKLLLKALAKRRDIIQEFRDTIAGFEELSFEESHHQIMMRARLMSDEDRRFESNGLDGTSENDAFDGFSEKSKLIAKPGLCSRMAVALSTFWAGLREASWNKYEKREAARVLYDEYKKVDAKIMKLKNKKYDVCKVFVTFVHEESQRNALKALTTGYIPTLLKKSFIKLENRYNGNEILYVEEPPEPTDIVWYNLENHRYIYIEAIIAVLVNGVIITLCYLYIVFLKSMTHSLITALGISLVNALLPQILYMTSFGEIHVTEGEKQVWLFKKLTFARVMNTAIINFVTTDFASVLSSDEIRTIQSILIVDAIVSPTINLLDLSGLFKRHIRSRFAQTQTSLMACFTKTDWQLGERYASMSKTLFVALFYAALYPPGMFIAALCFMYTYWVDKYLLLRKWKKPPQFDSRFAYQAVQQTMICVLAHILVTANWYFEWPFDNVVLTDEGFKFQHKENVHPSDYSTWYKTLIIRPASWQNADQRQLVLIYGTSALALTIFMLIFFFGNNLVYYCTRLFYGFYRPLRSTTPIPFYEAKNAYVQAYVPMCYPSEKETVGALIAAECQNLTTHDHLPILNLTEMCRLPKMITLKRLKQVQQDLSHPAEIVQKMNDTKKTNVALDFNEDERKMLFGSVKGYL
mmetsp:Transcript_23225/g.30329  ORF Transcript_23225/g.30329 Transcript_23225/m.30329 type:complete len:874 (-) Transcript_23225:620-3241(-)